MFLIDRETEILVRRAFMIGGTEAAAKALRTKFRGLDEKAATTCATRILSWAQSAEPSVAPPKCRRRRTAETT